MINQVKFKIKLKKINFGYVVQGATRSSISLFKKNFGNFQTKLQKYFSKL